MRLNRAVSTAFLSTIITAARNLYPVHGATYQLSYDAWMKSSNTNEDAPPRDTGFVASNLASHFLLQWKDYTVVLDESGSEEAEMDMVTEPPVCSETNSILNVSRPKLSFTIHVNVIQENNNSLLRIDVTMTSADVVDEQSSSIFARDALVNVIPSITSLSSYAEAGPPSWSITQRSTPSSISVSHAPSSIESIILSNTNIHAKQMIYSNPSKGVQIWSHKTSETSTEIRELYLHSNFRTTTSPTAIAHAEAFIHPALLSHEHPEHIAVLSDTPLLLLREILKYKSIKKITLVDVHPDALIATLEHIPQLNDCSTISTIAASCLDDERVEVISEDLDTWLGNVDNEAETESAEGESEGVYDLLFMDVASMRQQEQYLCEEYHEHEFRHLVKDEGMIVLNVGSMPSIHDVGYNNDEKGDWDHRADFLKMISTDESSFYGNVIVYDEPLAAPLDTTFISIFSEQHSATYFRYVRTVPMVVDLDMVQRFHKQQSSSATPTKFYDGSTHKGYLTPSRAWENWYCQSNLGRDRYECQTLLQKFHDPAQHVGQTEVRRDALKGRALIASNDIPKGSFINADDSHLHLHIHRYQWEALKVFVEEFPDAHMYSDLKNFIESYGFENEPNGLSGWSVSIANKNTFTNHACQEEDESAASHEEIEYDEGGNEILFSPLQLRRKELGILTVANRNISSGDEIMMNYSSFRSQDENGDYAQFLRKICNTGEGLVPVEVERDEQSIG